MLKQLFTLARGRSADASQSFLDLNAITLLRQQMREAAVGVDKSRKAVAVVMAYADREKAALVALNKKITDLETRAIVALDQDREDLAAEAAGAIAELECEREATQKTIERYTTEIDKLREILSQNTAALNEMKRRQRIAEATEKTQRIRGDFPRLAENDLSDASQTLNRLQERQEHADATMAAMNELSMTAQADTLTERMAAAGMGAPIKTTADDVLARLKSKKAN